MVACFIQRGQAVYKSTIFTVQGISLISHRHISKCNIAILPCMPDVAVQAGGKLQGGTPLSSDEVSLDSEGNESEGEDLAEATGKGMLWVQGALASVSGLDTQ